MARVFADTNVLFPFSIMDLMLALTEDAIHEVVWTEALLAEWERVIVREHHRAAESAASITAAIRGFFPEGRIAEEEYAQHIQAMPGDDPDDPGLRERLLTPLVPVDRDGRMRQQVRARSTLHPPTPQPGGTSRRRWLGRATVPLFRARLRWALPSAK